MKHDRVLVGILANENPSSARDWVNACKDYNIAYKVIDISADNWLDIVTKDEFIFFVLQPPGNYEKFKTMYDERLYIITYILGLKTFPSYEECLIYENKKMSSYYFGAKNIPHPATYVFYNYDEADKFFRNAQYPIVAKTSIGASGSGVKFIKDISEGRKYIKSAFKGSGIHRRFGPNRVTGNAKKWFIKALHSPQYFYKRLKLYFEIQQNAQLGYVIFQEYIPHDFEWRLMKIGESFFAHKKIKIKGMASGGKVKEFGMPDEKVLDFVENLCNRLNFNSVNVDLFEHNDSFLVNEIQCVFGIPYGYLSEVENKVGRFIKINDEWKFEEGDFTKNECCNLRLETALKKFGYNN